MTILATYPTMRTWFASPVATVAGAANNGSGLVRVQVDSTASFVTGTPLTVAGIVGTAEANGRAIPTVIDATHFDIQGSTFSNAYTSGGKVYLLDDDGMPSFPGPRVASTGAFSNSAPSKLRAGGFASSWTATSAGGHVWSSAVVGAVGPLIATAVPGGDSLFPLTITIDSGADDGGVDSYAWWLSQRGEPVRRMTTASPVVLPILNQPQVFILSQPADNRHSGTLIVAYGSAEVVKLFPSSGGTPPTDPASLATLFLNSHLYVCKLSTRAYQWARFVAP